MGTPRDPGAQVDDLLHTDADGEDIADDITAPTGAARIVIPPEGANDALDSDDFGEAMLAAVSRDDMAAAVTELADVPDDILPTLQLGDLADGQALPGRVTIDGKTEDFVLKTGEVSGQGQVVARVNFDLPTPAEGEDSNEGTEAEEPQTSPSIVDNLKRLLGIS